MKDPAAATTTPSQPPAPAWPKAELTDAEKKAKEFENLKVSGPELKKKVDAVLKGLVWHDDLMEASAIAAATGKPILWVEALGDVNGFT